MSENEGKKNISSIGIIKKLGRDLSKEDNQIGVEADIPIEEEVSRGVDIAEGLKVNEGITTPSTRERSQASGGAGIKDGKVNVFNISSGKIMERGLVQEEVGDQHKTTVDAVKSKEKIFVDRNSKKDFSSEKSQSEKFSILIIGIVVLLILLSFFLFKSVCTD
ncbi:MAG: hypothetical protein N2746_04010 [Deltaproteobacteria bacterium]|nr:hypothetical protein [Deltaproteobacteria bacterium]